MDNRKDRGLDISSFVSSEKGIVKPVYKPPEQRSKVRYKEQTFMFLNIFTICGDIFIFKYV